jgi:hypothetical protein
MPTTQHGRRHEIEFYSRPDANELLAGVTHVLGGPGIAFRQLSASPDGCTIVIEEVDIWRTLQSTSLTLSSHTRTVPIVLTCECCKAQYNIYRVVNRQHHDQRTYYHLTRHCPACPAMSQDAWLASLGYWTEAPPVVEESSSAPARLSSAINMADFN